MGVICRGGGGGSREVETDMHWERERKRENLFFKQSAGRSETLALHAGSLATVSPKRQKGLRVGMGGGGGGRGSREENTDMHWERERNQENLFFRVKIYMEKNRKEGMREGERGGRERRGDKSLFYLPR